MEVPGNWPAGEVTFQAELSYRHTRTSKRSLAEGVVIQAVTESAHPARGELGLFASRPWERFDIIGEYVGTLRPASTAFGSDYVAELHGDWTVDARLAGNEMRFVNDYRNIAARPNVTFRPTFVNRKPHLLVVVTEAIAEGEEILVNYGDDYWTARQMNAARVAASEAVRDGEGSEGGKEAATPWLWAGDVDDDSDEDSPGTAGIAAPFLGEDAR